MPDCINHAFDELEDLFLGRFPGFALGVNGGLDGVCFFDYALDKQSVLLLSLMRLCLVAVLQPWHVCFELAFQHADALLPLFGLAIYFVLKQAATLFDERIYIPFSFSPRLQITGSLVSIKEFIAVRIVQQFLRQAKDNLL